MILAIRRGTFGRRCKRMVTLYAFLTLSTATIAQESLTAPFTVRNAIETQTILTIGGQSVGIGGLVDTDVALWSPDQTMFLVRTRSASIESNDLLERILLFNEKDFERKIAPKPNRPADNPRVLLELHVHSDFGTISSIQWLDATHVGYLAEGHDGIRQGFSISVTGGAPHQLTHSRTDVVTFAMSGHEVVYFAMAPKNRLPDVVHVDRPELRPWLFPEGSPLDGPMIAVHETLPLGQPTIINAPAFRLNPYLLKIWISPDGQRAIAPTTAANAPEYWAKYKVADYEHNGFTPKNRRSDSASADLLQSPRLVLIDLQKNTERPLIDAPSGSMTWTSEPLDAWWLPDSKSVIVTNTFLPLDVQNAAELERRMSQPAVAEINLSTGAVLPIAWEPGATPLGESMPPRAIIHWNPNGQRLTYAVGESDRASPDSKERVRVYARTNAGWKHVPSPSNLDERSLKIAVSQGLNLRPKLVAALNQCRCSTVIFDPNPSGESFSYGHANVVRWTDRNGIEWNGVLVLPPGYEPGKRYPLVIQTHGVNEHEFLIDGPDGITTAMAAQPLASAGIVVLQVAFENRALTSDEHESHLFAEGYRSGIEHLVKQGIVDPKLVGVIAFSRTGLHVIRLLAEYPHLLAAVDTSDAAWWGYVSDTLFFSGGDWLSSEVRAASTGLPESEQLRRPQVLIHYIAQPTQTLP